MGHCSHQAGCQPGASAGRSQYRSLPDHKTVSQGGRGSIHPGRASRSAWRYAWSARPCFSCRHHGPCRDRSARCLRESRRSLRRPNCRSYPRTGDPHGYRVEPLAHPSAGPDRSISHCTPGRPLCLRAGLDRTVRSRRLAAAGRFPRSLRRTAAAFIDPRRRPLLIRSRRTLRPHAIASNLESRPKRRHQKRRWSIERRTPLGPPRHPPRRPDRSLLHHRHRRVRRSARSEEIAQHGTRL